MEKTGVKFYNRAIYKEIECMSCHKKFFRREKRILKRVFCSKVCGYRYKSKYPRKWKLK